MSEYISRQAAIDAIVNCTNCGTPDELRKYVDKHSLENGWTGGVLDAMEAVEDMPAADVVPVVHGKWVDHDGNKVQLNEHGETCGTCFCSRCGEWLVASDEYAVKGYFCPNCGAKMDA